jgi:hypothetical protein
MILADEDGCVTLLVFPFQKSTARSLRQGPGAHHGGRAGERGKAGGLTLAHPLIFNSAEALENYVLGRIVTIYPDLEDVVAGKIQRVMAELFAAVAPRVVDHLPGLLPSELYPMAAGESPPWGCAPWPSTSWSTSSWG